MHSELVQIDSQIVIQVTKMSMPPALVSRIRHYRPASVKEYRTEVVDIVGKRHDDQRRSLVGQSENNLLNT